MKALSPGAKRGTGKDLGCAKAARLIVEGLASLGDYDKGLAIRKYAAPGPFSIRSLLALTTKPSLHGLSR